MSSRFVLSTPASDDLEGILSYVLEESGAQRAQHVADHLREAFHRLTHAPGLGHRREDLTSAPVLFCAVWSYLVVYKPDTTPLEMVRVLHGARDVGTILADG